MAKVDKEIVSPFSMSDEEIKQKIYETHAHPEKMLDVDSLFIIVENILMHSIEISEEIVAQGGDQVHDLEKREEKTSKPDSSVPLSTLKHRVYEEDDHYWKVVKVLKDPTDIVDVLWNLFSTKDYVPPLIADSTKLGIEELRKKHVLLLISGRVISDAEIDLLNSIHNELSSAKKKNYDQYKIVWVPIMEQWTYEPKKLFKTVRSKIRCYIIELDRVTPGVRFIKKEWDFNGQPMVVVMNPQGKVENPNALYLIRLWGIKAFPFHRNDETRMLDESNWFGSVMTVFPDAKTLMDKEDYIFFFGGRTMGSAKEMFESNLNGIAGDAIMKIAKMTIKWYHVGAIAKSEAESFWIRVESMFLLKLNQEKADLASTQEIQKLLSYKNEEGWAMLSKGPVALITGRSSTFIKVLEDFIKWKDNVRKKTFEVAFKDYYSEIMKNVSHCCRLDIPILAGKAPERMKCAECECTMEMFISYKCCAAARVGG